MTLKSTFTALLGNKEKSESHSLDQISLENLKKLFSWGFLSLKMGRKEFELIPLPLESDPWNYWRFLFSDETSRTIWEVTLSESDYTWHGRLLYDKYSDHFDELINQLNKQKKEVEILAKIATTSHNIRIQEIEALQDEN